MWKEYPYTLADDAASGNDPLNPFIITKPLPEKLKKIEKWSYLIIHVGFTAEDQKRITKTQSGARHHQDSRTHLALFRTLR